jgi:hypothetical protein
MFKQGSSQDFSALCNNGKQQQHDQNKDINNSACDMKDIAAVLGKE